MKNQNKNYKIRLAIVSLMVIIGLTMVSCNPIQGKPSVKIDVGKNTAAGSVTVSVNVTDYNVSADTGHIVYYLDASVPTYYAHSAISKAGTYAISSETSYTWTDVAPGEHVFAAQLVLNDDTPLPIPATDSVKMNIGAPAGEPQLEITMPEDGSSIAPGNIMMMLKVSNFMISEKNMGVINRKGEGHLIYYIDEDPPVDQGIPATTDTSIVSVDLQHLWKLITAGMHTFSVQLVNNDDTPLETPVVASITIDVAAGS